MSLGKWFSFKNFVCVSFMVFMSFMAFAIVRDYELSHTENPKPIGQDIGGGVRTTCHGRDRLYLSDSGSIAVVHNDTTCDSEG